MKKLIIAVLAASGATLAYAQAETNDREARGGEFRAEMRALIAGDGMDVGALTGLMQERSQARFEALDTDGDGIVTREEFIAAASERAKARFERMGPNEDGVVTRTGREGWGRHHRAGPRGEGRGEHRRMNAEERAERQGERIAEEFARLDADSDGMISLEEFEAGMQARAERFAEHRQQRAERRERHAEHRAQMPEGMREMRGQLRALMRDGMDLDSFSTLMTERAGTHFDRLDADGNGELTADEFTANVAERAERVFARMDRDNDGLVTSQDRPPFGGNRDGGPRKK